MDTAILNQGRKPVLCGHLSYHLAMLTNVPSG